MITVNNRVAVKCTSKKQDDDKSENLNRIINACLELWEDVPERVANSIVGEQTLIDLLSHLKVEYAGALCDWYSPAQCALRDASRLLHIRVERLVCDNCGKVEYRCHPPNGKNWSKFQDCRTPHEVGMKIKRPDGDIFICTACCQKKAELMRYYDNSNSINVKCPICGGVNSYNVAGNNGGSQGNICCGNCGTKIRVVISVRRLRIRERR